MAVMKNLRLLLTVIFLISLGSSFQQLRAQEKTKEQQEADLKLQQKIDEQKKALVELKKAQEDATFSMDSKKSELDSTMNDVRITLDKANLDREKIIRDLPRGNRFYFNDEPFEFSGDNGQTFFMHSMGGDSERTTWDFSKTVKDNTFSKDYSFDVEKSAKSVVMSVNGDCKSGEIRIKIIMPSGKSYSDILIDESGNLNWRKSFNISETENQDKTGDWKFQISSTKASGFFKISLQAF
jgi:ATPase subunit of ABC transporter with duplicated ATPase domains